MKFAITTLGCKVNQYESDAMSNALLANGYELVDFKSKADLYVINTCTVTEMAAKKSRQMARKAKRINELAVVVVTGCLAQNTPNEVKLLTNADIVLGNQEKGKIVEYINKHVSCVKDIMSIKTYNEFEDAITDSRTRAYVKIQDGCANFCTYCIIPFVRGPVRSRKLTDIVNEVVDLTNRGIKEIVLTGIHLDSYGSDLHEVTLLDVLQKLQKIKGLHRIRLSSLEPTVITPDFINQVKKMDKFCHHFHLSLQAGHDKTLKRMNRKYSISDFNRAALLIYEQLPDCSITTDIIVGFPGETEDDFLKSMTFVKKMKFLKVHVFPFSKRKGTKAYDMIDQIPKQVKSDRAKRLSNVAKKMTYDFLDNYIGKKVNVLTEEIEGKYMKGHTRNYITVLIDNVDINENVEIQVLIKENHGTHLKGVVNG
ncbi:MAG: tRNA (N(6)-L-threonylcarbamoyladenosine(37)-C(2))-methylthiotransferase MtaB [Clostridiales bacterium]|nr:tRNA (N(6)-L-threonylcarbamoyladenosine(37)-C(2))-methylthiotransferase MtaB [Clostridiales bacterium]